MSNDETEDVIEATIRRIAAERAAREADQLGHDEAQQVPLAEHQDDGQPDESLIEATIRRIEADQVARSAESQIPAEQPRADVVSLDKGHNWLATEVGG